MKIDTHTHVWSESLKTDKGLSYQPNYHVGIDDLHVRMNKNGMTHAVLVQPSFVKFNNDYMLKCLTDFPETTRGVINFDTAMTATDYERLYEQGVRGVRLNFLSCVWLMSLDISDITPHLEILQNLGMCIEIYAESTLCMDMVHLILPYKIPILIDHFGMPVENDRPQALKDLTTLLKQKSVYMKFSGAYRIEGRDDVIFHMINTVPPDKMMWGSDYPHTRFEYNTNYDAQIEIFNTWIDDKQQTILWDVPKEIFKF